MRTIVASIAGIFLAIIGIIVFLLIGREDRVALATDAPAPEVIAERQAPATRGDPMTPVTQTEATRRAELHERIAGPAARQSAAVMAPSVVTEVRSANVNDPLSMQVFDPLPSTPEPAAPEPEPKAAPFVEPAPEPQAVVVAQPEPVASPEAPAIDPSLYRDRFHTNTTRPGSSFGVRTLRDGIKGPLDFQTETLDGAAYHPAFLDVPTSLASAEAGGNWFEPFRVAGNLEPTLFDPVVRPQYALPQIGFGRQGPTGYSAPLPEQRSAARPALVGTDPYGNVYTTGEQPNPYLAALNGPIVLARSGDLLPSILLYGFNSDDVRGLPIYGVIQDYLPNGQRGPLDGGRIQGQVAYSENNAAILFDTLILENGREFPMSAIAVSLADGQTGVASNVDRHRLARYGSLFLSGIIQGFGEIGLARLGSSNDDRPVVIVNSGSGNVNVERDSTSADARDILAGALAPVGTNLSGAAAQGFDRPATISAPAGYPFAVVFTSTLVSDPAEAVTAFNPRTGRTEVVGQVTPQEATPSPVAAAGAVQPFTFPETGETFTPAVAGPPGAVLQSLGAAGQ